jgi:amino acid transporter
MEEKPSFLRRLKNFFIGKPHDLADTKVFQHISLIAFFAWVGLGADGLSSSCYGPQEAFLTLGKYTGLSIFVALASVLTIFIISASYSQIVELFPNGGGGYMVASKLLSPRAGMVSGCALLIDYVLTIAVSIASGADALFSLMPVAYQTFKIPVAVGLVILLIVLNMRGVKESVLALTPIFIVFVLTHVFVIIYAFFVHRGHLAQVVTSSSATTHDAFAQLGIFGVFYLCMRSYSMGAGTYTGIEAVSNAVSVLREPRVKTAKRTMIYMGISLAFMVFGLMLAYLFYNVHIQPGKTLNAVLFDSAFSGWNPFLRNAFIVVLLFSEAAILFVAAQTGFSGGPCVLANMAVDRWFPAKFSVLSDRLVMQNGVLIMGVLSAILIIVAHGSVAFLVVLYSINVFITFVLAQLGMVIYWWRERSRVKRWRFKITVNGIGLVMSAFILVSMMVFKFFEGGWITLVITGGLVFLSVVIKRHYNDTVKMLNRLDNLVAVTESSDIIATESEFAKTAFDPKAKTAVLFVNGFNGTGLHTLFGIIKNFKGIFKNFVFVQVGIVDSGNFKGVKELDSLRENVDKNLKKYVDFMQRSGFYAEGVSATGVDIIEEASQLSEKVRERFPDAIFFGGQLVFPKESFVTKILHNHVVFTLQRKLYQQGILFVILPIRI